ncbi:hypothetical protein Tco_0763451, partial [Tanacetum coccineum]
KESTKASQRIATLAIRVCKYVIQRPKKITMYFEDCTDQDQKEHGPARERPRRPIASAVVTKRFTTASLLNSQSQLGDIGFYKLIVIELIGADRNEISEKNVTTPATVKAVEEVCVTCGSNHNFNNCPLTRNEFPVFHDNIHQFQQTAAVGNFVQRNPPNLANQMRPPGFNQPNVQNNQGNQSRYQGNNFNSNQNRGNNFNHQNNQGQVFQPPTNQPPVYQVPPYQAPTPQIQGVSKTDFENYVKANDAVLKNVQNQGTLPSQTVTNPWNGYLRKGRKTKPKRQNRARNGKAGKRQSQKAQGPWMAGMRALKSLTEETQERRAET